MPLTLLQHISDILDTIKPKFSLRCAQLMKQISERVQWGLFCTKNYANSLKIYLYF
ncbi:hypothetical protein RINTU1_27720 [Candidatus Regiella insecticola]|uniref:Uncharacterized protein n=1 Tax=Candidatus Regiella insecticola TaxID=138073 RepID=A0A6L2ZQ86_9ENTR|nr:hypothetical protein RINTU1_27720 [Candidatus Regiella insecticola]